MYNIRLPILLVAQAMYLVPMDSFSDRLRCPEYSPGVHVLKEGGEDIYAVGSSISTGDDAESLSLADRDARLMAHKLLVEHAYPGSDVSTISGVVYVGTCRVGGVSYATLRYNSLTRANAIQMKDIIEESMASYKTPTNK